MDGLLIAFLTLLNGAFAMSELALASSRKGRLVALAESGDKGAQAALALLDNPTQFLSSVQVGITSIGMLNGIVGEAAFSDDVARALLALGMPEPSAAVTATAVVVVVITFITIVFGELVPKRIGQLYPETVSRWVSRPMVWVARLARPFVSLLSASTHAVLRLFRIDSDQVQLVTEEEIRASLEEGVGAGVIEAHEHRMVHNVLLLDDRSLTSIMQPRGDIVWLDSSLALDEAAAQARQAGHSWYPVCRGGLDDVIGVIHLPRLLELAASQAEAWYRNAVAPVFVPETLSGMELLEQFRERPTRLVFVVDEYGVVQGLLTPLDMLQAITGELSPETPVDAWATPCEDGSWLVDGAMPVPELKARLDIDTLPDEDRGRYNTVAGLMQSVSGDLLREGERIDIEGWTFEVLRIEGRRIDRVAIRPMAVTAETVPEKDADA